MCMRIIVSNLLSLLVFVAIERGNHKKNDNNNKTLYISEIMAEMFLTTYLSC